MAPSIALARDIPGTTTMDGAIDTAGGLLWGSAMGGLARAQAENGTIADTGHHPADGHEPWSRCRANADSYGTSFGKAPKFHAQEFTDLDKY